MSSNHLLNTNDAGDTGCNPEKTFVVIRLQKRVLLPCKPAALPKIHGKIIPKPCFVISFVLIALMSGVVGCLLTIQSIDDHFRLEAAYRQTNRLLQSPNNATSESNAAGLSLIDGNKEEVALPALGSPVEGEDIIEPLRQSFRSWLDATNKCDINKQMSFYNSKLNAFYLGRGLSQKAVRAEKVRVFGGAHTINVNADEPAIIINPDRSEAIMRFRKSYNIEGNIIHRTGEVLQELRWQRVNDNWLIVSERDLLVMR